MTADAAARTGPFEPARAVADAVLFEGYMLYPYRANDAKNEVRWQFGVLAPPALAAADPSERTYLQTECLLEGTDVRLEVQLRFLHAQRRTVQAYRGGEFVTVDSLEVGDATYLPWDEAVVFEQTVAFTLPPPATDGMSAELAVPGAAETEVLRHAGRPVGRLLRERMPLRAQFELTSTDLPGPYRVRRIRLRLENRSDWRATGGTGPNRPDALRRSLVAAHLLCAAHGGAFVSLIDTPEWAAGYAEQCQHTGAFPVLAGAPGSRDLVFASPIILYDHPQIAPESGAQFCDATEMDEMLTLRTLTLTDAEKRYARGSDARAAALVDQIDTMPPELIERLHGVIRSMTAVARAADTEPGGRTEPEPSWWNAEAEASIDPETDFVVVDGIVVAKGTAVVLRPGPRRGDAQDMFLVGRRAQVHAVICDVDGGHHLAVTVDDIVELADAGFNPHGRFLYFAPDEVEPVEVIR